MAIYNNKPTTIPVTAAGSYSTGNITITGGGTATSVTLGSGPMYTTAATTASWANNQAKVRITDKDIEIDGWSLRDTLQTINDRLGVMVPNPALEKEFTDLKECADRYRELEKKFLDQKKMWDTLKKE